MGFSSFRRTVEIQRLAYRLRFT